MAEQIQVMDKQLEEFLHMMEVSLRSGYNVRQSLEIIVSDGSAPLAVTGQALLDDLDGGMPLPDVLDNWLVRQPGLALDMVVAAFHVQFESGGNLANKLQFLSQLLRKMKYVA